MSKNKEYKKKIIKEIKNHTLKFSSIAIANYSKIKATQMDKLRKEARKSNIYIKVIKNNIMKIAIKDTNFEYMKNKFKGQILIAINNDPTLIAKLFTKFIKKNKSLKIKNIAFENKIFKKDEIKKIANLPNKKNSIIMLYNAIQSPIIQFINNTKEITNKLIKTLIEISKKKH